jgi:hypothetical protein
VTSQIERLQVEIEPELKGEDLYRSSQSRMTTKGPS